MWGWLKRLQSAAPRPILPRRFSSDYWVYSTACDEEIEAAELTSQWEKMLPGSTLQADKTWRALGNTLGDVRASLLARTNLIAEDLAKATVPVGDTAALSVTMLIDHSGSMGDGNTRFALLIAEATGLLTRKLGLQLDALGFTTCEWRGMPTRGDWLKYGRMPRPGRLCALRHIVYQTGYHTGIPDLRAMFLPGVLKENVDGEALLWAADRARKTKAKGHLIIVVSDGAPVDDSTLAVSHPNFLWDHLKSVIAELLDDKTMRLVAAGLGHYSTRLYADRVDLQFFGDIEQKFLPFLAEHIRAAINAP